MNQILHTEDSFFNYQEQETKQIKTKKVKATLRNAKNYEKALGINLRRIERKTFISMIIICCICLVFSYCIYACGRILNNDETLEEVASVDDNTEVEPEMANEMTEEPETITTTQLIGLEKTEYTTDSGDMFTITAILNIPSLGIRYPVLSKNSDELMEISLSKFWGPEPNEVGNCVIVGHNYRNLTHFGKLPSIEIGDEIEITDTTGKTLTYIVYKTYTVKPEDTACTSQLTDGRTEITLITCTNGGATRLVVKAVAIEK